MIAIVTAIYTLVVVPKLSAKQPKHGSEPTPVFRNIVLTLRDPQFLKTIWLIGLPAKAVLTGVILFALPLLLIKQGFRQEDVGQITMTYGAAVIAASAWVSARANWRRLSTGSILVLGALLSGCGLLLISTVGWKPNGFDVALVLPSALVVVIGVIIIGVGHGFINAPVIAQVAEFEDLWPAWRWPGCRHLSPAGAGRSYHRSYDRGPGGCPDRVWHARTWLDRRRLDCIRHGFRGFVTAR